MVLNKFVLKFIFAILQYPEKETEFRFFPGSHTDKISSYFRWVDRYHQVVFTNGSNIYIATYYPYRLYRH